MNWTRKTGNDQQEDHKRRRMAFAEDLQGVGVTWRGESPAIARDGGISSPDVLTRTGGPKSISK